MNFTDNGSGESCWIGNRTHNEKHNAPPSEDGKVHGDIAVHIEGLLFEVRDAGDDCFFFQWLLGSNQRCWQDGIFREARSAWRSCRSMLATCWPSSVSCLFLPPLTGEKRPFRRGISWLESNGNGRGRMSNEVPGRAREYNSTLSKHHRTVPVKRQCGITPRAFHAGH